MGTCLCFGQGIRDSVTSGGHGGGHGRIQATRSVGVASLHKCSMHCGCTVSPVSQFGVQPSVGGSHTVLIRFPHQLTDS